MVNIIVTEIESSKIFTKMFKRIMAGLKLCALERKRLVLDAINGLTQRNASCRKTYIKAIAKIQGLEIKLEKQELA